MNRIVRRLILLLTLASTIGIVPKRAGATHLAGSDISYTCLGGNTYRVELTFYRDCSGSPAPLGVGIEFRSASCSQYFTDTLLQVTGTGAEITYPCPTTVTRCDDSTSSVPGIQQYKYSGIVTLPMRCADWVISWTYCCRNCDITTMVQQSPCIVGSNPGMYIAATLDNLNFLCNSSPRFTNNPVSFLCVGQNFTFNHGVSDPDGDSLVYSLVNPMQNATDSIPFVSGFSATNPISSSPALTIDPFTGDLVMTPTQAQVGVLSVLVQEYRNGVLIGSVIRDIEIYVRPCNNNLPTASGMNGGSSRDTTICPGTQICFDVFSNDIDPDQIVTMTWNQGISGATFNVSGFPFPTGRFCWTAPSPVIGTSVHSFTITVRDNACPNSGFQTYSYTIRVASPVAAVNTSLITCNGANDGSITIVPASGGVYTYLWSPGNQTTSGINGLGPGTYSVAVRDTLSGCTYNQSFTLQDPPVMTISVGAVSSPCAGANSGVAYVTAQGGVPGYTYLWNTNPPAITDTVRNLASGTYQVIVTDNQGCSRTDSVTIQVGTAAVIVAVDSATVSLACFGDNNGVAAVSASGGVPSYSYSWNTVPVQTDSVLNGLGAGTYLVTVTDQDGCTGTASVVISQPTALSLTGSSVAASCNVADGEASVSVSGGTPFSFGYEYLWNPGGATTASLTNLFAGVYDVSVTDSNGCVSQLSVTVANTNLSAPNISIIQSLRCNGDRDAIIVAEEPAGGVGPFIYTWNTNPPQNTDTVRNLGPGTYSVIVEDANGCLAFGSITISEPDPVIYNVLYNVPQCAADSSIGSVQLINGGTPPYSFLWSPYGGTDSTSTNLGPGIFTVTVTDANGCSSSQSISITQPDPIVLVIDTVIQPSCYASSDGSVNISVSGGQGPYTYFWNPGGATTEDLSGIDAGIYVVTINDQLNCVRQFNVNVNQPPPVPANAGRDTAICFGSSMQLNATLLPGQTGIWSGGPGVTFSNPSDPRATANGLLPGFNTLVWTVTSNGCTGTDEVNIFNYTTIVPNAGSDISICGTSPVQLNATTYPGFTGMWTSIGFTNFNNASDPNTGASIIDFETDTLRWTITNNACVASDYLLFTAWQPVSADAGEYQVVCVSRAQLHSHGFVLGQGTWTVVPPGVATIANPNADETEVSNLQAGTTLFLWEVVNGACAASDTVSVLLEGPCELELPSGFSPNGDGFNDGYFIRGIEGYPLNYFRVFNRWGNEIFYKENYVNSDWTGLNKDGDPLPEGTYFVILEIKNSDIRKTTYVDLRRYTGK